MIINDNVLFASYQVGVRKVVSAMTTAVLASDVTHPADETKVC